MGRNSQWKRAVATAFGTRIDGNQLLVSPSGIMQLIRSDAPFQIDDAEQGVWRLEASDGALSAIAKLG